MKNAYFRAAMAVLLFCLMQGVGNLVLMWTTGGTLVPIQTLTFTPPQLAAVIIITGVASCLLLVWAKMVRPREAFSFPSGGKKNWVVAFLAAVTGIFAVDLLGEKVELPDLMAGNFMDMAHDFWGILSLAVVGPLVEEIYFREGIQGSLHRAGVSPWMAILVSAFCFGVIHFNPAQVPFAFCIGVILGVIYYKTGHVVLTSLIHIFNNSMAVVEMRLLGEEIDTFSYEQALGGAAISYVYIAVLGLTSLFLLRYFWKNAGQRAVNKIK